AHAFERRVYVGTGRPLRSPRGVAGGAVARETHRSRVSVGPGAPALGVGSRRGLSAARQGFNALLGSGRGPESTGAALPHADVYERVLVRGVAPSDLLEAPMLNRRSFLQSSGFGVGGLALAYLLHQEAAAEPGAQDLKPRL